MKTFCRTIKSLPVLSLLFGCIFSLAVFSAGAQSIQPPTSNYSPSYYPTPVPANTATYPTATPNSYPTPVPYNTPVQNPYPTPNPTSYPNPNPYPPATPVPYPTLPTNPTSPPSQNSLSLSVEEPNPVVAEIKIIGNYQTTTQKILETIKTREGRPFLEQQIEEDTRALRRTKLFVDVRATAQKVPNHPQYPNARTVTFELIERPILNYVKMVGNRKYPKSTLLEECGLKAGDALDPISVRQAKERLETYYKSNGFHRIHIEILRGDQTQDRGAVFLINEGTKQRIYSTEIVGNSNFVSAARLKTQVESKPSFLYLPFLGGDFTRKKLDDDIEKLTKYYRDLGFYHARIDADFEEDEGYTGLGKPHSWVRVRFIVSEGPRCRINELKFVGNNLFTDQQFLDEMLSKSGEYYNGPKMLKDINKLRDMYGNINHVFVKVEPDMILDEDRIDMIFQIKEGSPARIDKLNVEIIGKDSSEPQTKLTTVLDRVTLKPGAPLNAIEMNRSTRLLRASSIFNASPATGFMPTIDFTSGLTAEEMKEIYGDDPDDIRGQSPRTPAESESESPTIPQERAIYGDIPTYRGQSGRSMPSLPMTSPAAAGAPYSQAATYPYDMVLPNTTSQSTMSPSSAAQTTATPYIPATQTATNPYTPLQIPTSPQGTSNYDPAVYPGTSQSDQSQNQNQNYGIGSGLETGQNHGVTPVNFLQPPRPFVPGAGNPTTEGGGVMDAVFPGSPAYGNSMLGTPDGRPRKFVDTPVTVRVQETRTGMIQMSVGVNSDSGLQGNFTVEEKNFDWRRYPRNIFRLEDWRNAFRGGGQLFRFDASPGVNVSRYEVNWQQPYLFHTKFALGLSGFYYQRYYTEWKEGRAGGSVSLGYSLTPDLRVNTFFNAQEVTIENRLLDLMTPPDLAKVLGHNAQYTLGLSLTHDTRDSQYLATEGHSYTATVEQVFGDWTFQRASLDLRKYLTLHERPDTSGRWVLGLRSAVGVSSDNTPIYERYYAGGFTTLRGFEFRGVSPRSGFDIPIGGNFQFYNSAELLFPISADDMIRGVVFLDTGTVESRIDKWQAKYRVAPGFGLRLAIPMMGPVPIALDFAFPISKNPDDRENIFQFYMSWMR